MTRVNDLIARIRLFYSPLREPLRRRVYTALLAIVTLGVTVGVISGALAVAIGSAGAAVLAVPAVEYARRAVTPVAAPVVPIDDEPGQHAAPDPSPETQ